MALELANINRISLTSNSQNLIGFSEGFVSKIIIRFGYENVVPIQTRSIAIETL